jgi:flagellar motor switch protein FliG
MMLLGDKKKKVATIIAKIKDSSNKPDFVQKIGEVKEKEVDMSKPEKDNEVGLHAAAADLISAIHAKDEKRAHKALMAHYEMAKDVPDSDEESAGNEANMQSIDD